MSSVSVRKRLCVLFLPRTKCQCRPWCAAQSMWRPGRGCVCVACRTTQRPLALRFGLCFRERASSRVPPPPSLTTTTFFQHAGRHHQGLAACRRRVACGCRAASMGKPCCPARHHAYVTHAARVSGPHATLCGTVGRTLRKAQGDAQLVRVLGCEPGRALAA